MRRKKLKTLFSVLAATLVIAGVNYTNNNNIKNVYGAEVESQAKQDITANVKISCENSPSSIDPVITIINNSDKELNLKDLNLKYFGSYGEGKDVCACYYAGTNNGKYSDFTNNVEASIKEKNEDSDKHLNIDFNGGVLAAGQSMSMHMTVHKTNWFNYENIDKSTFTLSVYNQGKLIDGKEDDKDVTEEKEIVMPEVSVVKTDNLKPGDLDSIKVIENGNEFLGIEGLEEGKDYTCERLGDEIYIKLNESNVYINSGTGSNYRYRDFYLNFENNIRQVATIFGFPMPGIDFFNFKIDGAEGKRGEYIKVPITMSTLWENLKFEACSLKLKYDTDIFEDAYLEDDSMEKYIKCDKDKGIISINYILPHMIELGQGDIVCKFNLMLKIKDDALIGATKLTTVSAYADATDEHDCDCYNCGTGSRGLIYINK